MSMLPEVDTTTLGGQLKKARLEAGLSQQDMARLLSVHLESVRNWERGRSRPLRRSGEKIGAAIASLQNSVS